MSDTPKIYISDETRASIIARDFRALAEWHRNQLRDLHRTEDAIQAYDYESRHGKTEHQRQVSAYQLRQERARKEALEKVIAGITRVSQMTDAEYLQYIKDTDNPLPDDSDTAGE